MNEIESVNISYILSNAALEAYEKIKALIKKIFSLLEKNNEPKSLKEEFYESYIDFACKLDDEGYQIESNIYMSICEMYHGLIDRSDELIAHEGFFLDLFNAFDGLLYSKIVESDDYELKYNQFLIYFAKIHEYYYSNLAIPSPYYDENACREIISHLSGDLNK